MSNEPEKCVGDCPECGEEDEELYLCGCAQWFCHDCYFRHREKFDLVEDREELPE